MHFIIVFYLFRGILAEYTIVTVSVSLTFNMEQSLLALITHMYKVTCQKIDNR